MSNQKPIRNKAPIIVMAPIEPGTNGDLSFVDKMIDTYQKQKTQQDFIILLNDLGDESLANNNFVKQLVSKVGENNVRIIKSKKDKTEEGKQSWNLQQEILDSKPKGILYGPMIVENDCKIAQMIATVNNIPFVSLPEYSYRYIGSNNILTGPGPDAKGMFLDEFKDALEIHPSDIKGKIGEPVKDLKTENEIFFAYMNNHSRGRGTNPKVFQRELLSYLYFVTGSLAHKKDRKPAQVFTRITEDILNEYRINLEKNNPGNNIFEIKYKGENYRINSKDGVGDPIKINFINPFPVKKQTMIALMQACKSQKNPICSTGDQSLSEAVSIGVPFFYQAMPWKEHLAEDLKMTAESNNLSGISEMVDNGLFFKEVKEAYNFAEKFYQNKDKWASQFIDLKKHISNLYTILPKEVDSKIRGQSSLGYTYRHRFHAYAVNPNSFKKLKDRFKNFQGDKLKAHILADFKDRIQGAGNVFELDLRVEGIKSTPEYKVLLEGQDMVTRVFGLETSSIKEFNKIVEDMRVQLSQPQGNCMNT